MSSSSSVTYSSSKKRYIPTMKNTSTFNNTEQTSKFAQYNLLYSLIRNFLVKVIDNGKYSVEHLSSELLFDKDLLQTFITTVNSRWPKNLIRIFASYVNQHDHLLGQCTLEIRKSFYQPSKEGSINLEKSNCMSDSFIEKELDKESECNQSSTLVAQVPIVNNQFDVSRWVETTDLCNASFNEPTRSIHLSTLGKKQVSSDSTQQNNTIQQETTTQQNQQSSEKLAKDNTTTDTTTVINQSTTITDSSLSNSTLHCHSPKHYYSSYPSSIKDQLTSIHHSSLSSSTSSKEKLQQMITLLGKENLLENQDVNTKIKLLILLKRNINKALKELEIE